MSDHYRDMKERAEKWIHVAGAPIVTRDSAIGEEHMALDVLELLDEMAKLRARIDVLEQECRETAERRDAAKSSADRMFSALDQALTLSDVPERDQDEQWYADRARLGRICDDYVGFVPAKEAGHG